MENKWISVKEKMPEFDERVLVYKKQHKKIEISHVYSLDKRGYNWTCDYGHYVTHWQYLPEPPKQ